MKLCFHAIEVSATSDSLLEFMKKGKFYNDLKWYAFKKLSHVL